MYYTMIIRITHLILMTFVSIVYTRVSKQGLMKEMQEVCEMLYIWSKS